MSRQDELKKQIINHQRRLSKLKEKQALKGINADVDLPIEIEDIETEIEQLQAELKTLPETIIATAQLNNFPPTPRGSIWVVGSIAVAALLISLAVGLSFFFFAGPSAEATLVASIVSIQPEVEVKRKDTSRLEPAAFGMLLVEGDIINTYAHAAASIVCKNGNAYKLEQQSNLQVDCEDTANAHFVGQLTSTLGGQLVSAAEGITLTLASNTTRGSRSEQSQIPFLLIPRNTFITDTRPTFQWQPVPGARGYRLTVNPLGGSGKTWSIETTATSLPYPADGPSLAPGSRNSVTLVTLENDRAADKTLLQVLDKTRLAELAKAEAEIRALPLDEAAQTYLLAQLYRQRELWAAAIAHLEQLLSSPPLQGEGLGVGSTLRQQLGDLYFQVGLYTQAEENYQAALTTTEASGDLSGQAAASAGLARVAYAFEETKPALEYLSAAEALYRQVGQTEQAERIAAERAKLKP